MATQTLRCTDYSRAGNWHVAAKLPCLFGNCGLVSTANNRKENCLRSKSNTTNLVFGQFQRFTIFYYYFFSILLLTFIGIPRSMCDVRLILWTYPFLKKIYIQYIRSDCIYKNLLVRLRLWRFGFWVYPSTTRKKRGKIIKNYYILREWRFKRLWPLNNVKWTNIFFCCFIYLFTQYDLKPPLLN